MNFSPLMGKFEGRYSLIAGTFFSYCQCFEISVCYLGQFQANKPKAFISTYGCLASITKYQFLGGMTPVAPIQT